MKRILTFLLFLLPVMAFAQFPDNPRRIVLGYQTTADGIYYRASGAPAYTPSDSGDARLYIDTSNDDLYFYNGSWRLVAKATDVDSTRLTQDSILVYYQAGSELDRDTIQVLQDGDKGDITVSGSGTSFTIDNDAVGTAEITTDGVDSDEIAADAVGPSELAPTAVTPGSYTYSSITVDQEGRLTAAGSGTTPVTGSGTANFGAYWTGSGTIAAHNSIERISATNTRIITGTIGSQYGMLGSSVNGVDQRHYFDNSGNPILTQVYTGLDTMYMRYYYDSSLAPPVDNRLWLDLARLSFQYNGNELFGVDTLGVITAAGYDSGKAFSSSWRGLLSVDNSGVLQVVDTTGLFPGSGGGAGDVTGPGSSTDNAIARFDGATGKIIQNSAVTISDAGRITLNGGNIALNGEYISRDGDDEGIFIQNDGRVAVQTNSSPSGIDLTVGGNARIQFESSSFSTNTYTSVATTTTNTLGIIRNWSTAGFNFSGYAGGTTEPALSFLGYTKSSPTAPAVFFGGFQPSGSTRTAMTGTQKVFQFQPGIDATFNTGIMTGLANGNVGIIETSPAHELDVTGDISATGSLISDGGEVQMNSVGDVIIATNAGTPESVVTADPGSLCMDITNGILYVKASGTGSTGWVPAITNPLTANLETNGFWLSSDGDSEGVFIEADGDVVTGGSTADSQFHSIGASQEAGRFEYTDSGTSNDVIAASIKHTTDGDMANSFGVGISFRIEDSAGIDEVIGRIVADRQNNDDDTGSLYFSSYNNGTPDQSLSIVYDGTIKFDNYTTGNNTATPEAYAGFTSTGKIIRVENSRAAFSVSGTAGTVLAASTAERINNDTNGTTTDEGSTSDWTIAADGATYTGSTTRDFYMHCTGSVSESTSSAIIFSIADEGTVQTRTEMTYTDPGTSNTIFHVQGKVTAATNDTFSVYAESDGTPTVTINNLQCSLEPWDN